MALDISKYVEEIVKKLTGDSNLLANFKKDPIAAVKSLLKVDLDSDTINAIIKAVKGKLNLDEVAGKAGGILGKLKSLFGKK